MRLKPSPRDYDRQLYAARHLIENFFAKIKQFRAIATRYEKTARNFLAAIHLVASVVDRRTWERTFNIYWGSLYHSTLPMLKKGRRGAHREHEQHQRLLGVGRPICAAYRIFGREVRGEGLH